MSDVRHNSNARLRLVSPALFVLATGLALAACSESETASAPDIVRPVRVMKVEEGAPTSRIVLSGSVKARSEAGLGFRVPGKIVERLVDVGDYVEPGEVLARLDTADLDLALRNAEATVVSAKSRLDVAEKALGRYKTLLAKGFIAQSVLDLRQLEFDQASASLDSVISTRDQARNQAAYSELKADAAGIVTEIRAEVGQVVEAGTPVVVVARDGDKEVAIAVPENEIRYFAVGDKLAARFWADDAIALTGTVREVSGSAEQQSRTFGLRVSLPEDPRVRLGMTATLSADVPVEGSAMVVPLAALSEREGKPIVWVVNPASQTVAPRIVETEAFAPDGVRISGGLLAGELVVSAGTQFMTPDKKVRIANSVSPPAAKVATR